MGTSGSFGDVPSLLDVLIVAVIVAVMIACMVIAAYAVGVIVGRGLQVKPKGDGAGVGVSGGGLGRRPSAAPLAPNGVGYVVILGPGGDFALGWPAAAMDYASVGRGKPVAGRGAGA